MKKTRKFESGILTDGIIEYNFDFFPIINKKTPDLELHGEQYLFMFENGYGASVVRHVGAYCDLNIMMNREKTKKYKPIEKRQYEIAILNSEREIINAPIEEFFDYQEVAGFLNYKEINKILNMIKKININI